MLIDTGVGYTASITSFSLKDFYYLCQMMTVESDLKSVKYVWVDAICVDQTNYERRKATIYQMTNIYEHAKYIVAVPDLHAAYLRRLHTMTDDTIIGSWRYCNDIYHLIHGNFDELAAIEKKFLDDAKVPNDPVLRQLLTKYTDHFMDGFMKYKKHDIHYNHVEALDHIYETSQLPCTSSSSPAAIHSHHLGNKNDRNSEIDQAEMFAKAPDIDSFEGLHDCDNTDCPLSLFGKGSMEDRPTLPHYLKEIASCGPWKQLISDRSKSIRQSMELLIDLIEDWSTRVWVISEFNIAKKKNNLKFWFIQLAPNAINEIDKLSTFLNSILTTTLLHCLRFKTPKAPNSFLPYTTDSLQKRSRQTQST
ncbi:hypothetical protein BCR42DRAFT_160211 [Absidia repens]|uniref:Heterokaryon incompatibility domain-containing protein n=1 Tax=Absidia repens TaxID=90262 RepID=A0A1X2I0K0_9FUNG|nr:hypothetical protein BCR42DRAFT_160211 [Absidia repens]